MTGSLQIKNGVYYAVINTYDHNGKRKPKWVSTGYPIKGNKKKAEKFLSEKINDYEAKKDLIHSDVLFSDYIRKWLIDSAIKIDEVTRQSYEATAKTHLLPYFDKLNIKLIDVTSNVMQEYINNKYKSGRIDGKGGLSSKTIRYHKNILQQTLKEAVRNMLLNNNPCDNIIMPKLKRHDYQFYNEEQIIHLLKTIKDEPLLPIIKLTVTYGLRRSEVLGLKWDSIDMQANTLTIKHTVSMYTTAVEKDTTKNDTSYRSFPLTDDIKQIIMEAKESELLNMKLFGKAYNKNDYIFKWENGTPYSPSYITHKWGDILTKYNLPHIRFHELRHSSASFLIAKGFGLKDIQEWLGHADIKLTANIYSHLDVSRKNTMADAFSNSFK